MNFSVRKHMLTFFLTTRLLTILFLGCMEPAPCFSNVLVMVCPVASPGEGNWKSTGRVASWPNCRKYGKYGEQPFDLWTELRDASFTYGSRSDQVRWFLSLVLAKNYSCVRFVLSITAFDCGWKALVRVLSIWSSLVILMKNLVSKLKPWSV